MPAVKLNYVVLYKGDSQVYGSASKDIALASPPPEGFSIEDKRILFITQEPDSEELVVRPIPLEEIRAAEIIEKKKPRQKYDADDEIIPS